MSPNAYIAQVSQAEQRTLRALRCRAKQKLETEVEMLERRVSKNKFGQTQAIKKYRQDEYECRMPILRKFMETHGCEAYMGCLTWLASSDVLSDKQKLNIERIVIPPLEFLRYKGQEEKDLILQECLMIPDVHYFVGRLLLAALYNIGANANRWCGLSGYPLHKHLLHDDIPLLTLLLENGANADVEMSFYYCQSVAAVELLMRNNADFCKQHQQRDLIEDLCSRSGALKEGELLSVYLQYIQLDATNKFGKKWFDLLGESAHWFEPAGLVARTKFLLLKRCHYDDNTKKGLFQGVAHRLEGNPVQIEDAHQKLNKLFKKYEYLRLNTSMAID